MTSIADSHLVVERKKLTEYLLNSAHPHGARKAAFFRSLGYSRRSWKRLANDLKQHARANGTARLVETPFGRKHVVAGPLGSPVRKEARVVAIWIVEYNTRCARLVTAYPGGRVEHERA
ncbi:MAG: DUF6883 domain-containing protein [Spirochaetaceae bacterium]